MVHVVIFPGEPSSNQRQAVRLMRGISEAYIKVRDGVWIVDVEMTPSQLRDFLSDETHVPILVVRLTRSWASRRLDEVATWLKEVRDDF